MADALLWFSLLTAILGALVAAVCAVVCWKSASACTSAAKSHRETAVAMADLQSSYDSLLASHRKLAARVGMRHKRGRDAATDDLDDIPPGDKAALRARYLNGRTPQEIARQAMSGFVSPNED
jgi:hypothetical protein